jgi:hypothetical protein
MIWKETGSKTERRLQIKEDIIERFKSVYPNITRENKIVFILPDKTEMKVISLGGTHFDHLVMNYKSDNVDDDGDLYSIDDYETVEELFSEMLEETKRG